MSQLPDMVGFCCPPLALCPGIQERAEAKAGVQVCFGDLWPVVPWVSMGRMERLRAKGTGRSVTPELEKSVVTWISLQSSTQLTFNLLGAAWGIYSRCLYGVWADLIVMGVSEREERGDHSPKILGEQRVLW